MEWTFQNISKRFGGVQALSSVTLDLSPGVYGLIGPNGAGKSTLMNIAAGLLKPDEGRVLLEHQEISGLKEEYYRHIGYLPQSAGVYPEFTGSEFLTYFGILKELPKKEASNRARRLLEQLHLSDAARQKTGTYSGGMKQRLLIGAVMIGEPQIMILDEPTVGLDPKERADFLNLLADLSRDRIIFYSTHIIQDIDRLAERVIFLNHGRIAVSGTRQAACEAVAGRVFESELTDAQFKEMEQHCRVISTARNGDRMHVRYLADHPLPGSAPVSPQLEDVYFHVFESGGGIGHGDL